MAGHKPLSESQQLIARRRVARRLAMQGTYQWLITGNGFHDVYVYFQEEQELAADFRKCDAAFFHKLMRCAIEGGEELENRITPYLDRTLAQVDPIEHAVLRVATCELLNHIETPDIKEITKTCKQMQSYTPDIIKFVTKTDTVRDLKNLMALYAFYDEIIALGTGRLGGLSRVIALAYDAPFIFTFSKSKYKVANGQISQKVLEKLGRILKGV
jgi:N utilization substance protein B